MDQILLAVPAYFAIAICLKILINDYRKWFIDLLYFIPIIIVGTLVALATSNDMLGNVAVMTAVVAFLYVEKSYTLPKAIILSILSYLISSLTMTMASYFLLFFFPPDTDSIIIMMTYLVILVLISPSLVTFLFVKQMKDVRQVINENRDYQTMLVNLLILLSAFLQIITLVAQQQYTTINHLYIWMGLFGVGTIFILLLTFVLYVRTIENRHHIQRRKSEQRAMLRYMRRIEKQYTDMRKFKHDYRNILSSLDTFIDEDNMEGLKAYFEDKIKPVSEKAMQEDFAIDLLSKIRIREIKSILAIKLMMAQDHELMVELHVREEIFQIQTDTLALVRMLGIILDNAIEELREVRKNRPDGRLIVEVWQDEEGTSFIIQNTCRPDTPKLHHLQKEGFSTKGKGRGLGLSNLAAIMIGQPNVFLNTSIAKNTFTQKIVIGE